MSAADSSVPPCEPATCVYSILRLQPARNLEGNDSDQAMSIPPVALASPGHHLARDYAVFTCHRAPPSLIHGTRSGKEDAQQGGLGAGGGEGGGEARWEILHDHSANERQPQHPHRQINIDFLVRRYGAVSDLDDNIARDCLCDHAWDLQASMEYLD